MSEQPCHEYVNLPRGTVGYSEGWKVLVRPGGGQGYAYATLHDGYCPHCGDRLNEDGSTTRMVPAAPSAAVRETDLFSLLTTGNDKRGVNRQGQLVMIDLVTWKECPGREEGGYILTPAGRTILSALEGGGAGAQPSDMVPRAALEWLARAFAAGDSCETCPVRSGSECTGADDYATGGGAAACASNLIAAALEATGGVVPDALKTTQEEKP